MKKDNRLLKFFMPLIAVIYGFLMPALAAFVLGDEFRVSEYLLSDVIQIVTIAITVLIAFKVLPRLFTGVENFKPVKPSGFVLGGIILLIPLFIILKYRIIELLVVREELTYISLFSTIDELKEDLIAGISAVFLAPVLEELSFRYMALVPFKGKGSRIAVSVVVSVFFAVFHFRNFIGVFIDSLVMCTIFLCTKNIIYSIWWHMCNNLMVIIFGLLSYVGFGNIRITESYPLILLTDHKLIVICICCAVIGSVLLLYRRKVHKITV
ncbi:MAG: CPBP family intramembrane metalloprotease [Oscillospiraceae bacterium]|nr:CPBP family intramembrane metalloprotease [Oscillospiraceae bacterium]